MLNIEPKISGKRTMPFGTSLGSIQYARDAWIWHGSSGSYVRFCGDMEDAYCLGDRLIFRKIYDRCEGKWVGCMLDPNFNLTLDDFKSAMKWLHEANHQDWGCLFWSTP